MDLRDQFAVKAMELFLHDDSLSYEEAAEQCYAVADAMMLERERQSPQGRGTSEMADWEEDTPC